MDFIFKYGTLENNIDVTKIVYEKCFKENIFFIPTSDYKRADLFTDPLFGILKIIIIINNDNTYIVKDNEFAIINSNNNNIYINTVENRLSKIHNSLKIDFGSFSEEYPEQKMVARYLKGTEKVLEIGGNIGRNSLVIATILNNNNFVSLESDYNISKQLEHNKNLNNLNFYIENSALSKRKLIQRGWDTIPSDNLIPGYNWINTINLDDLIKKYNIIFDTLVLDCEGAFYYILWDMPEILNNINLIIMENDYHNIEHKNYIDNILQQNNFYRDYVEQGGWGVCYNNFFEVWKRN